MQDPFPLHHNSLAELQQNPAGMSDGTLTQAVEFRAIDNKPFNEEALAYMNGLGTNSSPAKVKKEFPKSKTRRHHSTEQAVKEIIKSNLGSTQMVISSQMAGKKTKYLLPVYGGSGAGMIKGRQRQSIEKQSQNNERSSPN